MSKKALILVCLFFILITLIGCSNSEKQNYKELKAEYLEVISNNNIKSVQDLVDDEKHIKRLIEKFNTDYPKSKYSSELEFTKSDLEIKIRKKGFTLIKNKISDFNNKKFDEYNDVKENIQILLSEVSYYLNKFPSSPYIYETKEIKKELSERESSLIFEEQSYNNIYNNFKSRYTFSEADTEISNIYSFIEQYPKTIKKASLKSRIEDLQFIKCKLLSKTEINTINELNEVIRKITNYKDKVGTYNISNVEVFLEKLENKRKSIYSNELSIARYYLENNMNSEAHSTAYSCHNICGFKGSSGNNPDVYKYTDNSDHKKYGYIYKMQGGAFCSSVYEVKVVVEAVISGNKNIGVIKEVNSYVSYNNKIE